MAGSFPGYKGDEDWSSVYPPKNVGGYIFPQKRENGRARLLRESNLYMFFANLCVFKSKKTLQSKVYITATGFNKYIP